jgi:predicted secreted protein
LKRVILFAMFIGCSHAFARDAKLFHNLGFSESGQYYAFLASVVQDGSGYPSADGYVIDVAANKLVRARHVVLERESANETMAIRQVLNKLQIERYGITRKHPGGTLWSRAQTDTGPEMTSAQFVKERGAIWPIYILNLKNIPVEGDCLIGQRSMIELSLTISGRGQDKTIELQRDTRLPKSRECSANYELRQVLQYKDAIAVILRYQSPGFEGRDENALVVTAKGVL